MNLFIQSATGIFIFHFVRQIKENKKSTILFGAFCLIRFSLKANSVRTVQVLNRREKSLPETGNLLL